MKNIKEKFKETSLKTKKEIIFAMIFALSSLLLLIGGSYAYFTANIGNKNEENKITTLTTATLVSVTLDYGDIINSDGMLPGHKVVKTLHITGDGNENSVSVPINITLTPHIKDFENHVKYSIYAVDNSTIDINSICGEASNQIDAGKYYDSMNCDTSELGNILKTGIFIDEKVEKIETLVDYNTNRTFYVIVEYINETEKDQNNEQGKTFTINLGYEGENTQKNDPIIMAFSENDTFWQYKENISNIIIENNLSPHNNAQYTFDVSEAQNKSVMAYLVPNESEATYTLYLQGKNKIVANPDSSSFFRDFNKLTKIEGLEYFDTANVTIMNSMFEGCSSLTNLDLSDFDTSQVTMMINLFRDCSNLTNLKINNFNTSNVTDMGSMFSGCSSITSLDVSSFNTSNVTKMVSMFYKCSKLIDLDLRHFDTSNVTNMGSMFYECKSLTYLDVSNFDTSNVVDMSGMFGWCQSLLSLDLSNFNTQSVRNMDGMFSSCNHITNLDLTSFNTGGVEDMSFMFENCNNLTDLNITSFDTYFLTNMDYMFYGCNKLVDIDLSSFEMDNVESMGEIFSFVPANAIIKVKRTNEQQKIINSDPYIWNTENVVVVS